MADIEQYLPFLIPLAIIQISLTVAALINIFRRKKFRFGNRLLWAIISVCITVIGPVLYFCVGRVDEDKAEDDD